MEDKWLEFFDALGKYVFQLCFSSIALWAGIQLFLYAFKIPMKVTMLQVISAINLITIFMTLLAKKVEE